MAIANVQPVTNNTGAGPTLACPFVSSPAAGNSLFALISTNSASATVSSISDTLTNSWLPCVSNSNVPAAQTAFIYYCQSNKITGANSVSVTVSSSGTGMELALYEFSFGAGFKATLDQIQSATGIGTAASSGNTPSTTNANELLLGYLEASTGFTLGEATWTATILPVSNDLAEYKIVSAPGAYFASGTLTSGNWVACIATFFASASGQFSGPQERFMSTGMGGVIPIYIPVGGDPS